MRGDNTNESELKLAIEKATNIIKYSGINIHLFACFVGLPTVSYSRKLFNGLKCSLNYGRVQVHVDQLSL